MVFIFSFVFLLLTLLMQFFSFLFSTFCSPSPHNAETNTRTSYAVLSSQYEVHCGRKLSRNTQVSHCALDPCMRRHCVLHTGVLRSSSNVQHMTKYAKSIGIESLGCFPLPSSQHGGATCLIYFLIFLGRDSPFLSASVLCCMPLHQPSQTSFPFFFCFFVYLFLANDCGLFPFLSFLSSLFYLCVVSLRNIDASFAIAPPFDTAVG